MSGSTALKRSRTAGAVEAAWRRLETFILEEIDRGSGVAGCGAAGRDRVAGVVDAARTGSQVLRRRPAGLPGAGGAEGDGATTTARCTRRRRPTATGASRCCTGSRTASRRAAPDAGTVTPARLPVGGLARGGPLPSGRAALAGAVRDPFLNTTDRVTRERREETCPDGTHGEGRTLGPRGDAGARRARRSGGRARGGPLGVVRSTSAAPTTASGEHYTLACHWDAGAAAQPSHGGPRGVAAAADGDGAG